MNMIFNSISRFCAAVLAGSVFFGCQQEELVKPVALLAESSVTVEAKDSEGTALTVYSDEGWMVTAEEDWISVTPAEGTGTMDILVSAEDNVDAQGEIDKPREGTLYIFSKRLTDKKIKVTVKQKGDNYKGVSSRTIDQLYGLEDGEFVKVDAAQVVALTNEGFVVVDKTAAIYVTSKEKVSIGAKVHLAGEKVTLYGMASVAAGEVAVDSEGEQPVYPEPEDLVSNLDPSKAGNVRFVTTSAGLLGRELFYEESIPVAVSLLDPKEGTVDLDKVNMHNITLKAYFVGLDGNTVRLAVTEVTDNGINENLDAYFYEDFSWMKSFIEASGEKVDDSVGDNNPSGSAPNLRGKATLAPLLDEFIKRGYQDLNQDAKVIYPQKYYWKFGKTNNHSGLVLPDIKFKGSEQVNVFVEFDWSAHMTGSGNVDNVQIVAEVQGAGLFENGTNVSDPLFSEQVQGQLAWQHAKLTLKGANNTTKITLRPAHFADATPNQQRWHLDNIKIKDTGVPYSDPVYANVTLSDELVTFEGNPSEAATLKIKSDKEWTLSKGADSEWFDIDIQQGSANEEVTVSFTCQPSTSANLRRGSVVLSSADTRKNIYVVQSAAGGELDPLISIVNGNRATVLGEGQELDVTVQSNVEYKVEISESWLVEAPATSSKALVEKHGHKFIAEPNMSGSSRTATVRFYNEEYSLESVLTVRQENFVPRIDVSSAASSLGISGAGCEVEYAVSANIPFTVSAADSWVKLPSTEGQAGDYNISVRFDANMGTARTTRIVLRNDTYDLEKTLTVNQFASGVVFADDFSWLKPIVDAAKAAAPGNYDTVGSKDLAAKSANIYGTSALNEAFVPLRDAIGYIIPGKKDGANDVLYIQEYYLKMGKTSSNSQTSLTLPTMYPDGHSMDVTFDWARMVQGSGKVDDYTLTLMIEGNGTFENGTKYSDPLSTPQATSDIYWTNFSVKVNGADKDTRITIVATDLLDQASGKIDYKKTGGRRIFIDNIVVKSL